MAHIIAFMDETLHIGLRGQATDGGSGKTRRRPSHAPRQAAGLGNGSVGHAREGVSTEEVRMDRVNALRAAIADGSYKVSAADLADKLLHTMLKS